MPMKSRTFPKPNIPDYLIYDEMKRRRERDAWQPDYLELPLYRPELPVKNPTKKYEDPSPDEIGDYPSEGEQEDSDRGVMIIDMNDLFDEDEDEEQD